MNTDPQSTEQGPNPADFIELTLEMSEEELREAVFKNINTVIAPFRDLPLKATTPENRLRFARALYGCVAGGLAAHSAHGCADVEEFSAVFLRPVAMAVVMNTDLGDCNNSPALAAYFENYVREEHDQRFHRESPVATLLTALMSMQQGAPEILVEADPQEAADGEGR